MATVGSILGGAFRLLRERPGSIAVWAVVYCVGSFVLTFGMMFALTGAMTLTPSPMAFSQLPGSMGALFGGMLLLYLCILMLIVVLMNAVFRTMLRPEEGGFFMMRIGMDELRMLGLVVLILIASVVLMVVGQLLTMLLATMIGFLFGASVISAILMFLLFVAYLCAMLWIAVRLSLIYPLTFHRRRISVDAAWNLTRGRFWLLFGCYFLVFLIFLVAYAVLFGALMGDYIAAIFRAHGDPAQIQAVSEAFAAQQAAMPLVARLGLMLIGAVFFAISLALGPGLLASATRELLAEGSEARAYEEAAVFAAESDGSVVD